ncbi:GntR family transcriptional regulator [Actinocorallia herbida]|uniref:GntR family transcriptional regulator n=1 Tax=Actinocorallia herbida TaxID=58109 RepID=A0A3N1D1V2_9ACTN|nr:FCD domain-containing protein [Actinocorallia herbida]ROO87509.1 GntR family transcriptional regulator [Actinocorallia herbida]
MTITGRATPAPTGPEKLATQIARRLEEEIIERGWPVGEILGTEAELREQFGVSRSVLRESIRLLEHHHVARMRRGPSGGLEVCVPDVSPATRALVIYLEYVGTSIEDLLRARQLLEPLAARLTADRLTEEGVEQLRAKMRRERSRTEDPTSADFHVLLARLSGNAVLQLFVAVLARLTSRYAQTSQRTSKSAVEAARTAAIDRHAEIVEAVIAGDAAAAQTRLGAHLDELGAWLLAHRVRRPSPRMRSRPADPDPDDDNGRKLAEVVAGRMHDDIVSDGLQVGAVFGAESDLLTRYGVSRAVLREAIRILEHHSVARMRRGNGGGLVVLAPDPTASIHTMALYLDCQGMSPDDLGAVREVIELGCVQAVSTTMPSPEAASRLCASLDRTGEDGFGDLFHTELADLTGNPVLTLFLRITTELWAGHGRTDPSAVLVPATDLRHVHGKIVDAVLAGDEALAQHRMRRHLRNLPALWH